MSQAFQIASEDDLRDESRKTGTAVGIAFPTSKQDIEGALAEARRRRMPLTLQGARTGITGGAVPDGGLILNLSRMAAVEREENGAGLRVEPGARLFSIREHSPSGLFFPPDPTEPTASIGGMMACNASGAGTYLYGPTRRHVKALRVLLANGEHLDLQRGRDKAKGLEFRLGSLHGVLPPLPRSAVKNAAGYYVEPDMDLLDLFIGAEGTLGILTQASLCLTPMPEAIWAFMAFFPSSPATAAYVHALRQAFRMSKPNARLAAMEYFDAHSLDFLRRQTNAPASRQVPLPDMPPGSSCLYVEVHADSDSAAEEAVLSAVGMLPTFRSNPDAVLLANTPTELERLKLFRHALPEGVNAAIDQRRKQYPGLTKLGTDMAVPDEHLTDILALYEADLAKAGLESVVFGHIGNNHLHVNILPRTPVEYEAGQALYQNWADQVIAWGGSISAEHGIGKLKRGLLARMMGAEGMQQMRQIKQMLDPDFLLNPGNLFLP
ncbi:MAG: FAD-binding oxidoreductase [Verrucomicrobiota bacterium]|nr:FAD-binding oxidoreductase [Verrucomicrobiota bacterium]